MSDPHRINPLQVFLSYKNFLGVKLFLFKFRLYFYKFIVISLAENLYVVGSTIPDANENKKDDEDLIEGLAVEKKRNRKQANYDVAQLTASKEKTCFLAHGIQGFSLFEKSCKKSQFNFE